MRPWFLGLAAGGAASAVFFLFSRKSAAAPTGPASSVQPQSPTPTNVVYDPTATYGEQQKVALAVPSGWRRVTNAEVAALPELGAKANALRNTSGFTSMAYGTLTPFTASDGKTYATWIEQHYHEPGGSVKPWGLHHGVTLLAQRDTSVLSDEWPGVQLGDLN